jgi:DNA-binding LacI/PurR family transcriptional regulator
MATIRDVAAECGVSTATVSNVVNNTSRPVHPKTRERVLEAARRLNYHPNAMARSLQGQRMNTIGVHFGTIEPEVITNPYASLILQGILTTAAQRAYNVTLCTARWQDASRSAAAFGDGRADGYIVVAPPLNSDVVSGLSNLGLDVVVISSQIVPNGVPFVDVDSRAGLRIATEHLIAQGHRKIAHMTGDINQPSYEDRRLGYLDAMSAAGLPVPPEYLVTSWYIVEESMKDSRALLTLPNRPTAIATASDHIACGILRVAKELGLSIPRDLSVTGFDDIPSASLVEPQLTTIRQPLVSIGQRAAQMLLEQIEGGERASSYLAEPALIVRGSTGAFKTETPAKSPQGGSSRTGTASLVSSSRLPLSVPKMTSVS